jgi:hypothetical protein
MMKSGKIFLLLLPISLLFFSCSDEKGEASLLGQWKLVREESVGWRNYEHDYSDQNIIYDFKSNGALIIREREGQVKQLNYFFEDKILLNDPVRSFLNIEGANWSYSFSKRQLILSQAYVDGPILTFDR